MLPFALVVPTLNPGPEWSTWLAALQRQTAKPKPLLIIDSSSDQGPTLPPRQDGYELITVPRESFDHGATRQQAFESLQDRVAIVAFMTQDAILSDPTALQRLISAFDDPTIAAAYGRQHPHPGAGPIAAHARLFNYGPSSIVKQLTDRDRLGLKTCFLSNSFAAYRSLDLAAIGGFPATHFGEDMLVAARLLLQHRHIAYVADASVYHSHDYTLKEEFLRYHATGRLHAQHPWLLQAFGGVTGEGTQFVLSEIRYLLKHAPHLLPAAGLRTLAKYAGYRSGRSGFEPWLAELTNPTPPSL